MIFQGHKARFIQPVLLESTVSTTLTRQVTHDTNLLQRIAEFAQNAAVLVALVAETAHHRIIRERLTSKVAGWWLFSNLGNCLLPSEPKSELLGAGTLQKLNRNPNWECPKADSPKIIALGSL